MKPVTQETFAKEIDAPCLAYFWAAWCGPCFSQEDTFTRLENEFPKINFLKVNCDENQQLAQDNSITAVPTVILFKKGKPVQRLVGLRKIEDLREEIKKL